MVGKIVLDIMLFQVGLWTSGLPIANRETTQLRHSRHFVVVPASSIFHRDYK